MATAEVELNTIRCVGEASCVGGKHPDPPLDAFPLLCWMPRHPAHGADVFTEDGAASVLQIATAICETPDYAAVAARLNTTPGHVAQAVDYALKAGYLGA